MGHNRPGKTTHYAPCWSVIGKKKSQVKTRPRAKKDEEHEKCRRNRGLGSPPQLSSSRWPPSRLLEDFHVVCIVRWVVCNEANPIQFKCVGPHPSSGKWACPSTDCITMPSRLGSWLYRSQGWGAYHSADPAAAHPGVTPVDCDPLCPVPPLASKPSLCLSSRSGTTSLNSCDSTHGRWTYYGHPRLRIRHSVRLRIPICQFRSTREVVRDPYRGKNVLTSQQVLRNHTKLYWREVYFVSWICRAE